MTGPQVPRTGVQGQPSHASPFDIHKSNLHLPCTVPGTNLIVATKCGLEYPQHITVSVQNYHERMTEMSD